MNRKMVYLALSLVLLYVWSHAASAASIRGWGYDVDGEISGIPVGDDFIAIAAGYHCLALKADGSIVGWGRNINWPEGTYTGQAVAPQGSDFIAIAVGGWHSMAVKKDGTIIAWGDNRWGQANPPAGDNFVAVACGTRWSLALRKDGTLVAWGLDEGQISSLPTQDGFVAIAAGQWHGLALKENGSVVCWGNDEEREVSDTPTENDFVSISTLLHTNYALRSDGSIVAWGRDAYGQVSSTPSDTGFIAVTSAEETGGAIRSDGSIVCWGENGWHEVDDTPTGNNFVDIRGGAGGFLALEVPRDTTGPTIRSISASPESLWPANHKMVTVMVDVDAVDDCDPTPVSGIIGVVCNEAVNGPGDGNTVADWEYTEGMLTIRLRAERSGSGSDRVYTLTICCMDHSGNYATGTVDVIVPHDQGKKK